MKQVRVATHYKNLDESVYADVQVFEQYTPEGAAKPTRTLCYSYTDGVAKTGAVILSEGEYADAIQAASAKAVAKKAERVATHESDKKAAVLELEKAGISNASAVIIVYGRNV